MTPVKVRVSNVVVKHEIKMGELSKWLERSNGSPREMMERKRVKSILGMETSNRVE